MSCPGAKKIFRGGRRGRSLEQDSQASVCRGGLSGFLVDPYAWRPGAAEESSSVRVNRPCEFIAARATAATSAWRTRSRFRDLEKIADMIRTAPAK